MKETGELSPRLARRSRNPRHRPPPRRRKRSRFSFSRFLFKAVLLAGVVYGAAVWLGVLELPEIDLSELEVPEIEVTENEPTIRYPGDEPLSENQIARWVVHYTNKARKAALLGELVRDPAIDAIAESHSEDMVQFGLFHDIHGKGPTDRALDAGYTCRAYLFDGSYTYGLSENIFDHPRVTVMWDTGEPTQYIDDSKSMARSLVDGWMDSPGHRMNILDPYIRKIGVGIAIEEVQEGTWIHETVYATQNFSGCN